MPATDKKTWRRGLGKPKAGLTRHEIALQLSELLDLPVINGRSKQASRLVNAVIDTITGALQRGETVIVRGFGTFSVITRQYKANSLIVHGTSGARALYDTPYITKPRKKVIFTPAPSLMALLNLENSNADARRVLRRWQKESEDENRIG